MEAVQLAELVLTQRTQMAKTSPLNSVLVIHGAKHAGPEGCSLSLCLREYPFSWVPSESDDKITCKACLAALRKSAAFWKLPPEQRVAIGRGEAAKRLAKAKKETLE